MRSGSPLKFGICHELSISAVGALTLFFAAAVFLIAPAASFGATVTDRPLLFSFDGSDTTAGHFGEPGHIAVDESTGDVYVAEGGGNAETTVNHAVSKFDSDGAAVDFSAIGSSSITRSPTERFSESVGDLGVAVDNSGGPTQGRLYVTTASPARLFAFGSDGSFLWEISFSSTVRDVAVDSAGHPWVLGNGEVDEYANTGTPPARIDSFPVSGDRGLDVDASGNVYVAGSTVDKYVGGAFDSNLDPAFALDVFADQTSGTGHIFTIHGESPNFNEYDSSGALVGTFGRGIDSGRGIAYNGALNRVYVADAGSAEVDAFGPAVTGTVPDPTIEAAVASGPGTATFHGKINPQGVPNAYYFEWSGSPLGEFARAFRSPLQSLPEDSLEHAVEFKATNLFGNQVNHVRLVAINTANGLRAVSGATEVTPPQATAGPDVTIDEPVALGPTSERISGTINPHEDSVKWKVETSTDPECEGGFETAATLYLPGGEINTATPVEHDLTGLLPAQHYCVRIRANNSFEPMGEGALSETKEFTTEAVVPSEVSLAFAAPRTDTSARINGYVNPDGEADVTYRFELSEDGVNWTTLPTREATVNARRQIVIGDDLTELQPDTTYHYRLALVENEAGPAVSLGTEKTFTTRTTAEMLLPQRGIELVNNPDKGDQNVLVELFKFRSDSISSPDGERAVWSTVGGAPGAPGGTQSVFLAERTSSGWQSRSLAPPAGEQVGEGSLAYELAGATPDFSRFVVSAQRARGLQENGGTVVRLDRNQHQEVLKAYEREPRQAEITDDGNHVVLLNSSTRQLEDIGNGASEILSIMPDGTESSCGLDVSEGRSFIGGQEGATSGTSVEWRPGYHLIADTDASRVYFGAQPNGECAGSYGLYMRNRGTEQTTLIDPGVEGTDVALVTVSPDGRHAYFATRSRLEPADNNEDIDLYRWDEESGESTCLSCVVPDAAIEEAAGSFTPILISSDFSHVYFESLRQLVPGHGNAGHPNLYALSGGNVHFVGEMDDMRTLVSGEAGISSDGDVLVFRAPGTRSLTADEVATGPGGEKEEELYLYDAPDASLECISCSRGGVTKRAVGDAEFGGMGGLQISNDGSTVSFVTPETLLPGDVNGGVDVYEWHDGSRQLITDGITEFSTGQLVGPKVHGMDSSGSNIFFTVTDPGLTGFEHDGLANLYDARIGGGFTPANPPARCQEDSCQGPLQAAPSSATPQSSTYIGPGNAGPASRRRHVCAKKRGRVKRGHCRRKHRSNKHKSARGRQSRDNGGRTK
jgi:hypothetical protein